MRKTILSLACGTMLAVFPSISGAQLPTPPKAEPTKTEPAKSDAATQRLTMDSLETMLKNLGYEPTYNKDKSRLIITSTRDGWNLKVRFSISSDATVLWMDTFLWKVEKPEAVPATMWLKLLKENDAIGPFHYAFNEKWNELFMYYPTANQGISPAGLRKLIDEYTGTLYKQMVKVTKADFEPAPILDPKVEAAQQEELKKLEGTWKLVKVEAAGKTIDGHPNAKFVFKGNQLVSHGEKVTTSTIRIDTTSAIRGIDLIENGATVACIYKIEGDTMTLCGDTKPAQPRPTAFTAEGFSDRYVFTFKKVD